MFENDGRPPKDEGLTQTPARHVLCVDSIPASITRSDNLQLRAFKRSPEFFFLVPKPVPISSLVRSSVDGKTSCKELPFSWIDQADRFGKADYS